jgi:hypothetical protein
LEALPEKVIKCVQQGNISSWAAARVLAPMARANTDHVKRLTESLMKQPLSTDSFFSSSSTTSDPTARYVKT